MGCMPRRCPKPRHGFGTLRPRSSGSLRRGEVEVVNVPTKVVKPCRFDLIIELRGVAWRRIQFEISPDEAGIGQDFEVVEPPPLSGFGLPDPEALVGIAMRFQIVQKMHAVSDPHEPPDCPSMIAPVTSSTFSCYATSRPRPEPRRWPRSVQPARPRLRPAPRMPANSVCRRGRGRRR